MKDTKRINAEHNVQVSAEKPQVDQQKTRKNKRKNHIAKVVFMVIVHVLGVSAIVGLSVALYYSEESISQQATYQREIDAAYSRAYYDLLDGANNMEVKLKKLGISASKERQQSLLYEVWGAANLAENNLGFFEGQSEGIMQAQKFVNQLGDYSHYLALKIADGETLTAEDRATLSRLGEIMGMLKNSLNSVQTSLDEGKLFVSQDGGIVGDFSTAFDNFTDPSMEYPQMIYDGPFSDALMHREVRGLSGGEIDADIARKKLVALFKGKNISNLNYIGEGGANVRTYCFSLDVDGAQAFAQVSKVGGKLIEYNRVASAQPIQQTAVDEAHKSCQAEAIKFAKMANFENLQVVWSASADGCCLVNLAPVIDGVIMYPDLVKVKVLENTNEVVGFDSTHHAFNNHLRSISQPKITEKQAREKLGAECLGEGRLALIPLQETKEILTYEFECEKDGTYFVYIDANTGKEVNILYVIDDANLGQSLM